MTPLEEFKIFLIRHDLPLRPAYDIAKMNPELLNKYSMEELAILSTYVTTQIIPTQKQIKIRPILYNCCQLMAMREKKTLVDWLDQELTKICKDLIRRELEETLASVSRKLSK